jgi:hypothetical protein
MSLREGLLSSGAKRPALLLPSPTEASRDGPPTPRRAPAAVPQSTRARADVALGLGDQATRGTQGSPRPFPVSPRRARQVIDGFDGRVV